MKYHGHGITDTVLREAPTAPTSGEHTAQRMAVPPRSCDAAFTPWGSRGMNLQLFAEDGGGGASGGAGNSGGQSGGEAGASDAGKDGGTGASGGGKDSGAGNSGGGKMLTQDEVDALIEKRLARERRDAEKRLEDARAAARKEGEERARMTEEERSKADRERAERETREREQRLRDREAEITRRELRAGAVEELQKRGLPRDLGGLLDYSSEDACKKSMDTVEKVFRDAVQAGIDARLRQGGGAPGSAGGGGKPDTSKMTDAEYYASLKK